MDLELPEAPPDHSTIPRTRRLIDLETHREVFTTWILNQLAEAGLVKGKTIGMDATTLEADAALCAVSCDAIRVENFQVFYAELAKASGVETPTREDLARLDRKRKNKGSPDDSTHPHDPDAKITKMKDRRTPVTGKAEHAVDLETGAVVRVTVEGADQGDPTTSIKTLVKKPHGPMKPRSSLRAMGQKRSSPTRGMIAIKRWWPWRKVVDMHG